ncbi:MAG: MBL fold metallo-hydrolase [bacterium]|nr:MBL fold metallo-hydrolase [bacterium]
MSSWKTELKELAPGIYAYIQAGGTWFINNAGFIVGKEEAIAVDSLSNEHMINAYIAEIKKTTDKPINFLINTHSHADHIFTNHFFPQAKSICHERCRETTMDAFKTDPELYKALFPDLNFDGVKATPQDITFSKEVSIYLDDMQIRLVHNGPAHTMDDAFVHIPKEGIVFCGDLLFYLCTPLALMGYITGWIETIDLLASLDADIYVPGHGPVTDKKGLLEGQEYLVYIQEETRKHYDAGTDAFEAAKSIDLGKFAGWADSERIVANVERLYSEFRGEEPGIPLDLLTIFSRMNNL